MSEQEVEVAAQSNGRPVVPPDTEVSPRRKKRYLTAAYKLRVLEQYDACATSQEKGELLRREGLYSASLTKWRRKAKAGKLGAKRGRKASVEHPAEKRVREQEREIQALKKKLAQADIIIAFQKKVSESLGLAQRIAGEGETS